MEIIYSSLLGFFLLLVIYLFYNNKSGGNANLPPGRTGFPVIGETLEFHSGGLKGHPEKFIFDRIAKYSSYVFKTSLIGSPVVVFGGLNGHQFLFSNENKLVQVWFPPAIYKIFGIAAADSKEEVIKIRNFIQTMTKPVALKGHIGLMDTCTNWYFNTYWEKKDMVVVSPLTKHYTFSLACRLFMGLEDPNVIAKLEKPFDVVLKGLFSIPIDLPGTAFNRAIKASTIVRKELLVIIKQRKIDLDEGRASPTQDLLSRMLLTSDENGNFMPEVEIAKMIYNTITPAQDGVISVCSSIVKYLAELPEVYQRVHQEQLEIARSKEPGELLNWEDIQRMKYSWNVACEVMRLAPPNQGLFKEALKDFTYNGFSIPKGWKLHWSALTTHRDPKFFPEPNKFDPSRFEGSGPAPYTYVAFGGGPRICPGKEFARTVILVFMHHLVKRFRWETIIPDEKIVYNPMANPEKGLPIRLFPHEA
ncbi:hypothetical protein Vadar_022544 [Vaccinium darrowii]|uniref:Uncharacterized protein n=1 Tax=Vaccinium darrowii TaxID=229202 RepID=A0ACB7Y2L0_9ERIC|nr:hypothetical protein Vadar_022544 [Vaccinium darrowii]